MAKQLIYKDIGIETESSFGASSAATTRRIHVISCDLNKNPNKETVKDVSGYAKGRDRIVSRRNEYTGTIQAYASPRTLHEMFELVNGVAGISAAWGATGVQTTYAQATNTAISKSINMDRNNSQEKYLGVRSSTMELKATNDLIEISSECIAKTRIGGASMTDSYVGETVLPFSYADTTITVHAGSSYGTQAVTQSVSDWSIIYDNGLVPAHLSGSKDIARSDFGVPTIKGKYKIFHEGASWIDATFGASEFYIRFNAILPSEAGLIGGVSQMQLRIDIPRSQKTTNVRNYVEAELGVEEVEFEGMFDNTSAGTSALWIPSLITGTVI